MDQPLRLAVLISGGGTNLQSIIDACASDDINAQIDVVISNRPGVYGLERAIQAGITTHTIDHTGFESRDDFDAELRKTLDSHQPDLVVLAGFMRILTDDFIHYYNGRMINIHPSLLPDLRGLNTHQRAIDAGFARHGCSVHFVIPELDGGAIVLQAAVPVRPDDDAKILAARVLQEEHKIYPRVIGWIAAGRLRSDGNSAWLDGEPIDDPLGLNNDEDRY